MTNVNILSENPNSTVISEYIGLNVGNQSYQSEDALEKEFIKTLTDQSYEYLIIKSEDELILNLRKQLELLNNYTFTDNEWNTFFNNVIANKNSNILDKTKIIQEDYIKSITLDDGSLKNIYLIDKTHIHNNRLQVINQYENFGIRDNRYDVTILVNGLPLIHVELKRRGVDLREAFNQINRYQRDSFWSNSGLYEYIQIFVISNGTYTKYYSNTTRDLHLKSTIKKTANTYEFTSYWSDQHNKAIIDLIDFTKTFFAKHTILNIITKYCIFTTDSNLLVMRPYQIVAVEKIINRINIAKNYKYHGSINAGGYIWHTTGSGKTLTSFKTSILASELDYIDKVLFVVDRKDLDYQTMKEYDKFQKGAADSNTNTKVLQNQLDNPDSKIIITTIQKLSKFVKSNNIHDIYNKDVVIIFDECHRSQFGSMHKDIIKKFNKYYLFGFTGTPIFKENCNTSNGISATTKQIFGDELHTYTIINAINDKNVLPFRYEYVQGIEIKDNVKDQLVNSIDINKLYSSDTRIKLITDYIVKHFSIKTGTDAAYVFNTLENVVEVAKSNKTKEIKVKMNIKGFNSIFAVSSIEMAKKYYEAFKNNTNHNLKVALIYSYGANDEVSEEIEDENSESTENLNKSDRDFLDIAINDYNDMFKTSYDTSSEKFQNYYKDLSLRMKNKEIDILIVANMFLTGFDATTLNTLWIDKNLKYHGLIQAFSRTNRILNSVKTYGNIVSFRDLESDLEDALSLFGDNSAKGIILLKTYDEYYNGYKDDNKEFVGYKTLVEDLLNKYPSGLLITSEKDKKDFVKLYGQILRVTNILKSFDKFNDNKLLTERNIQDYSSMYIEIYNEFKNINDSIKVDVVDDIVFEMELIKQIEVNIDYILTLVQKYHDSNMENKEVLVSVNKSMMASPNLRNKKDLILEFINSLNSESNVYNEFDNFMNNKRIEELDTIIKDEMLDKDKTYNFIRKSFENGVIETTGIEISSILPPMSMFSRDNARFIKKQRVTNKLLEFFNKFYTISSDKF